MSDPSSTKYPLAAKNKLERELNLKQLQINSLLSITQAINNNVKAPELFAMYRSFLTWEMEIKKMALFIKEEGSWKCVSHEGISETVLLQAKNVDLERFEKLQNLTHETRDPFLAQFDVVIPVHHKKQPIAYTLIGGFEEEEDMYNKVRFITTITNIIAVAIENKRLFKWQTEQELAINMQQMLIPAGLPSGPAFELASIYKPKLGVGGDYFDCIEIAPGKYVFCVADISGKGIGAALLMANFQASFRSLIQQGKPLEKFIHDLNIGLYQVTGGDKFLTLFLVEYSVHTRKLRYINGGHNPPVFVEDGKKYDLEKGCTILGAFRELPNVEVGEKVISGNATICIYTDGLTDTRNSAGDYFTGEVLGEFATHQASRSASLFNDNLLETLDEFREGQDFPDDLTVLTCKISA
ncbi:MAG: SpoIIE family protein phosphatase [Saprospiraceae bacterium]|nr:SpoIIE family protein phosphatase [Saprospiraceae bacterium]